jgi:hypothetical protein
MALLLLPLCATVGLGRLSQLLLSLLLIGLLVIIWAPKRPD